MQISGMVTSYNSNLKKSVTIDTHLARMCIKLVRPNGETRTVVDATFPNLKILSAKLAAELGFGYACGFLTEQNVSQESDLWCLNKSNPWKKS